MFIRSLRSRAREVEIQAFKNTNYDFSLLIFFKKSFKLIIKFLVDFIKKILQIFWF